MTETPETPMVQDATPTAAEPAPPAEPPVYRSADLRTRTPARRRGLGGYIVVALLALAVGAAGMFFGLRYAARGSGTAGPTP